MFDILFQSFRSVFIEFSFNWIYLNRTCTRILLIQLNTRDMILFFHTFSDSGFHIKRVFLHSYLLHVTFHTLLFQFPKCFFPHYFLLSHTIHINTCTSLHCKINLMKVNDGGIKKHSQVTCCSAVFHVHAQFLGVILE